MSIHRIRNRNTFRFRFSWPKRSKFQIQRMKRSNFFHNFITDKPVIKNSRFLNPNSNKNQLSYVCCTICNIGNIFMIFLFFFTDKPVIKKNPLTDKSAADLGETVRLVCEARGVPNVTFYWGRVGGQRLAPGLKYNMVIQTL